MANPVDIDNAPGNMNELEQALRDAVTVTEDKAKKEEGNNTSALAATVDNSDPLAGTKFEGKTVADILDSYKNLESAYGRMANDLGTQRKLTDRLLDVKREEDLSNNAPQPVEIDSAQLLDNPTQTLDRVLSERDARNNRAIEDRLTEMENRLVQDRFMTKHPDFMTVGQDPKFLSWAQESPVRAAVAQRAAAGDWDSADALLTEYKSTQNQQQLPLGDGVNEARQVSLETAAQGGESSSGKIYRRADLIQLKITRPDVYENPAFQDEILKAYNEGRVK